MILREGLRTLYIDMNGFFASVEQQLDPALRGRPVGITAVDADSGALVAASYEAKAFGVTTGTRVRDARRLCPGIVLRPSRHRLYVRINQRIAAVIDELAELERVRSIDEFQVGLSGRSSDLDAALDLARRIKAAIRERIGSELRCSIGLGPNQLLAKIAGKLEKPDGLAWLAPENMPERIAHLALDDLPGISRAMRDRLWRARVWDVPALYQLDPRHARLIWRSVEGERFVRGLQGENIPLLETRRCGFGNAMVLAPDRRAPPAARLVGRWLIEKSAARLRRDGWCAARFSLHVHILDAPGWSGGKSCMAGQDTGAFMWIYDELWREMIARRRPRRILGLGVQLGELTRLRDRPGELFTPLAPGEPSRREALSAVADRLNRRYGRRVLRFGDQAEHPGFFERG